jgi:hypothetical protein
MLRNELATQTSECFLFSSYSSLYAYGRCSRWTDLAAAASSATNATVAVASACASCSDLKTCSSCLGKVGCGWCHGVQNPIEGECVKGGFLDGEKTCSSTDMEYAYEECPDVDECKLGMHDCHKKGMTVVPHICTTIKYNSCYSKMLQQN